MLGNRTDLQVICEVSDGLEGVHQAEKLKPDLILLDTGLPRLNGIEALDKFANALQTPRFFLSQEFSPDMVQEAFRLGAWGYVVKRRVESDLLPALGHGRRVSLCGQGNKSQVGERRRNQRAEV
jgi:DNA-binding NarL/FixJ family response regulator